MFPDIIAIKNKIGSPPLVGYLPAGYPDEEEYAVYINLFAEKGLRLIEIGIPADDARLDGAVIRDALGRVSSRGRDVSEILMSAGRCVSRSGMAGLAMVYEDTLTSYGISELVRDCLAAGIAGLLVPNASPGEKEELFTAAKGTELRIVNFIGARMDDREVEDILSVTTGFLYLQSSEGSTGGQFTADPLLKKRIVRIKKLAEEFRLPVALGFGINSRDDALQAAELGVDAVVVGTAFVRAVNAGFSAACDFVSSFEEFLGS